MKVGHDFTGVTTPFYCTDGKGNFLLHRRSKNCRDEQGHWDPGSGRLGFGQDLEESVLREVREEYGCEGKILESLPAHSIHREHDGQKTHWVAIPFVIQVDSSKARNNEPEKIDKIGWFKLDHLPQPLHTGFQQTLNKYGHYLDKYRRWGLNPSGKVSPR